MKITLFRMMFLFGISVFVISCDDDTEDCTSSIWYEDADSDGLGDSESSMEACDQPEGYVDNSDDDDNETICTVITWYADEDEDGYGDPDMSEDACLQPDGYVDNSNDDDDDDASTCFNNAEIPDFNQSRSDCTVTLEFSNSYEETIEGDLRIVVCNNIPDHMVGNFPNADVTEQDKTYQISLNPVSNDDFTSLIGATGPVYRFGFLLNGVELDPVAAEPWPHEGIMAEGVNWDWNLEALNVQIGLDCNNAHVQPTGEYHHHGIPTLYLENLGINETKMTLVGYAADGFPIYYQYAYSTADDATSEVIAMSPSYQLIEGNRPGDGDTAPCGEYTGIYSADYEYVSGLGTLDEANGRTGATPEYPDGTYYYVLTEGYPTVPRYLRGTPSEDFGFGMGGGDGGPGGGPGTQQL